MTPQARLQKGTRRPRNDLRERTLARLDVEIAELEAEIKARESELHEVRRICEEIKATRERLGRMFPEQNSEAPFDEAFSEKRRTRHAASAGHSQRRRRAHSDATLIREAAKDALKREGRPLSRARIRDELTRNGVSLNSKNPLKRIGKVMWQAEEFRHVADGYWFSDIPVPETAT